jgi:flagellar hook-length control protein FliK
MASATPSISHSTVRKGVVNTASLFKAAPAKEEAGGATAEAGNSEQNLPRFADALKMARRQAMPERETPAIPQRQDETAERAESHEERAESEVEEKPRAEAKDIKADKPQARKDAAHDSAHRSEKSSKRRDHDDATAEKSADDDSSDAMGADETSTDSDDDSAPADDTKPTDTTTAADAQATQTTAATQAVAVSQQIAVTQVTPEVPAVAQPIDQATKPEADIPTAQPIVAQQQQPAPQPTQPATPAPDGKTKPAGKFARQVDNAKPAQQADVSKPDVKSDAKPVAVTDKKPAAPSASIEMPQPVMETGPNTPQLANIKPLVPQQFADHPDHPTDPQKKPAESMPLTDPLQAMQPADGAVPQISQKAAPEPEPVKPVSDTQNVVTTASAPIPVKAEQSAEAARPAQDSPAPDNDPTFEQVVMGLRSKLDARSGKAEIRLEPPNLGPLHVSLQLNNGSLTAQFQSSSDVVRDLLKSNMEKLKSVLEGQGIAVDKLAVGTVESSPDKVVTQAPKLPNAGTPNNDGRSAGQYHREQNSQKRSNGNAFGRIWRDATTEVPTTPVDLVG